MLLRLLGWLLVLSPLGLIGYMLFLEMGWRVFSALALALSLAASLVVGIALASGMRPKDLR